MFDLDQRMNEWRKRLLESNVYSSADIEELEAHILDALNDLQSKGLSQEEAFWVAVNRVGDVESLNREFRKVNQGLIWRRRIIWLLAGYFIIRVIGYMVGIVPSLVLLLGSIGGAKASVMIVANVIITICFMGGVVFLIFSKKVWGLPIMERIINFARVHYVKTLIISPVMIFVIWSLSSIVSTFSYSKLNPHDQFVFSNIKETYLTSLWQILLIASFIILVMLMKRSKSFSDTGYISAV